MRLQWRNQKYKAKYGRNPDKHECCTEEYRMKIRLVKDFLEREREDLAALLCIDGSHVEEIARRSATMTQRMQNFLEDSKRNASSTEEVHASSRMKYEPGTRVRRSSHPVLHAINGRENVHITESGVDRCPVTNIPHPRSLEPLPSIADGWIIPKAIRLPNDFPSITFPRGMFPRQPCKFTPDGDAWFVNWDGTIFRTSPSHTLGFHVFDHLDPSVCEILN